MPLYTDNKYPFLATEDIICYKLIGCCGDKYVSPMKMSVIKNFPCLSVKDTLYEPPLHDITNNRFIITSQGIHAFSSVADAQRMQRLMKNTVNINGLTYEVEIDECVIEKGTPFWKGTYSKSIIEQNTLRYEYFDAVAAEKITVLNKL